jgi:hypothetical protein
MAPPCSASGKVVGSSTEVKLSSLRGISPPALCRPHPPVQLALLVSPAHRQCPSALPAVVEILTGAQKLGGPQ